MLVLTAYEHVVQTLLPPQGQTRLSVYFQEFLTVKERASLEAEIVRKCLSRKESEVVAHVLARTLWHIHCFLLCRCA